jgi:hypothetical protein
VVILVMLKPDYRIIILGSSPYPSDRTDALEPVFVTQADQEVYALSLTEISKWMM